MRRILILAALLLVPLVPIVLVVTGVIGAKPQTASPVTLTIWGTADSARDWAGVIARYNATRPYATITYKQIRTQDYRNQLISAWAAGTGPDIFFVPSTWIGAMEQYALPMPKDLTVPVVQTGQGLFGTSTEVTRPASAAPSVSSLREQFVDGVMLDIVRSGQVWGLPLAMDTTVVYVNRDLLNNSQIFSPARTWTELLQHIDQNRLTVTDDQDNLVRSAVALGTIENVPHATDIFTLLMQQNGVPAAATGGQINFREDKVQTAADFYLSFANPRKASYSWSATQPNALDAFLAGKLAYYIGTFADRAAIASSSLNWTVSPMFHLSTEGDSDAVSGQTRFINSAVYDVGMVAKASDLKKRSTQAWNFLNYAARDRNVTSYLNPTGQLSALKSVLVTQRKDQNKQIFADQLLTARTWYRGRNGPAVEAQLESFVTSVQTNQATLTDALRLLGDQINAGL